MQRMMGLIRRCAEDYGMISAGDRIGVGVSGGKDSLALLTLLAALRAYWPGGFTLEAFTVDMGLGMDFTPLADYCQTLDVPFHHIPTHIGPILFEYRKEKNPCSMCAKLRRGALHKALLERDIHKIALGHHHDDAVETFLLSLLYEGRLSCFQPVTELTRTGIIQIRPMLYLSEQTIAHFAQRQGLPVVKNRCPADKHTKREEVKQLLHRLGGEYPGVKDRIFTAMQRLPLPEWGPEHIRQSKASDDEIR